MKTLLSFVFLFSGFAFASPATLYMKQTYSLYNSTGSYVLTCKFYHRQVEITEFTGMASSIRYEPTPYSGTYLRGLITAASYRSLNVKPFNICDGGSLDHRAYRPNGSYFTLKSFQDCGPKIRTRIGVAAKKLREIAQLYCPTFDPSFRP